MDVQQNGNSSNKWPVTFYCGRLYLAGFKVSQLSSSLCIMVCDSATLSIIEKQPGEKGKEGVEMVLS